LKAAIDTNVLAYAAGLDDDERRDAAMHLMRTIPPQNLLVPVQVLGELYAVLVRKGRPRDLARDTILGWRDFFGVIPTTTEALSRAAELASNHQFAIWDAIILAAAADAGCHVLLSEDMHEGFTWAGVTIVNPFASPPHKLLNELRR
jgi:predicted nucleic acid-binding protein